MPKRPDPPAVAAENRAFLRHLRLTGNAHEAARALQFSRTRFTKRRAADPAFAAAWDAALAQVHARLRNEPRAHRTPLGLRQIRRVPPGGIDHAAEQRFLLALSATSNITLSAKAAGFAPASFYARRRRDRAFAEQWRDALAQGYGTVELALLEAGLARTAPRDAWAHNDPPALPPMTATQAIQLLHLHQKEARLIATPTPIKRRRGETPGAHQVRLSAMYEAKLERDREAFRRAEAAREARGEERYLPVEIVGLPDLAQIDGWSRADPTKTPHDPERALFGGLRAGDRKKRGGR